MSDRACGARIVLDRSAYECEKPSGHGGNHWHAFCGAYGGGGGMAWSDFPPTYPATWFGGTD